MLIANKSFTYDGRRLRAGDEFEPKGSSDERLLTAIKHARHPEPKPKPSKARKTYMTRDMVAAPAAAEAVDAVEAVEAVSIEADSVPAITGRALVPEYLQQTAATEPDSDA